MTHSRLSIRSLLDSSIVWDNHGCMPLRADASFLPQLERYRSSGVTLVSLNIGMADSTLMEHLRVLAFMRRWIVGQSARYSLVSKPQDVLRCKAEGKLGIVFDIEGMRPVEDDISFVQTFYELGVRWMLIAYNRNNAAGGGCLDVDQGLTDSGRAIIDEMERVGMVLCLSHTGSRTAAEALEYGRRPMIFSHSNASAHTRHARNISDEMMRLCARKGGVIGLTGIGLFLGTTTGAELVGRLLNQLRYAIDLVGAEHVGLGLDYVFDSDGFAQTVRTNPGNFPAELDTGESLAMIAPECIVEIAEGLARANLTETQIRCVLGENWLRVAKQVWAQ